MRDAIPPNSRSALAVRRAAGRLGWAGVAIMLAARSVLAVAAQALVAALLAARGSADPWREAAGWLPVYGSLIDAGCILLLWLLARREGIGLVDLIGFERRRLVRDLLLGLALIPPCLVFIFAGILASSLFVYGDLSAPQIYAPLPLWASLYAVLVWPLIWGLTEQATYNGYTLPRLQALSGNTALAVAAVAFFWSFQHAVMPLTLDADFMLYRALAPVFHSTFAALVYLRMRRILPLATAHWLMDGGSAFSSLLWPLMR